MQMIKGASMSAIIASMFGSKFNNGDVGLSFYQPPRRVGPKVDTGAGMRRAAKRFNFKLMMNGNLPVIDRMTRQRRRNAFLMEVKAELSKLKRTSDNPVLVRL